MARVVHVQLAEPGGGAGHLDLTADEGSRVVRLDPNTLRSPRGIRRSARLIAEALSEGDILHAHGIRAGVPSALASRRPRRVPLVITIHGLHSLRRTRWPASILAALLNRWVISRADRALVLSDSDRATLLRLVDDPTKLVLMLPPARMLDPLPKVAARDALGLPRDGLVAVWVGRLEPEKDPLTFVRAIGRAESTVTGLLVGEGSLGPFMEAQPRVKATGWMDDVVLALSSADVYVNTSRWEGASVAALEAAHMGKALVLSAAPGNTDLRDRLGAWTFPVGDEVELARILSVLASDTTRLSALGSEAKSGIASFHTETSWRQAMEIVYAHARSRASTEGSDR